MTDRQHGEQTANEDLEVNDEAADQVRGGDGNTSSQVSVHDLQITKSVDKSSTNLF